MPPILITEIRVWREIFTTGYKVALRQRSGVAGNVHMEAAIGTAIRERIGNQSNCFVNGGTVTSNPSVAKKLN